MTRDEDRETGTCGAVARVKTEPSAKAGAKKPAPSEPRGFGAEDVGALAKAKLASSGLTERDAARLGMTWLSAAEAAAAIPTARFHLPSLKIPYYGPDGKPFRAAPKWPEFFRLRALRQPVPTPEDWPKYLQPPGTGVAAYFPRGVPWPEILSDHGQRLLITEGELKAAKATACGFPTISLGGVDSFQSNRMGLDFLPELEAVEWPRRDVVICFDSDLAEKPDVCRALWKLAERLRDRGALPRLLLLPQAGDAKVGLDDYLVAEPADALEQLLSDFTLTRPLTVAARLFDLSERYAYVRELNEVVDRETGDPYKLEFFHNWHTDSVRENVLLLTGQVQSRPVRLSEAWLRWGLRTTARRLTYDPGRAPLSLLPASDPLPALEFNCWPGWGAAPVAGDASPFLEFVDYIFTGADPLAREWFLGWCAWPLANPGAKLASTVVLHGITQGTGKSTIGETLGEIYGRNFRMINQQVLSSRFTEWSRHRQLVMCDDVSGTDRLETLATVKTMITQKELRVELKNQTAYYIPDRVNYLWTSNNAAAFYLEHHDRRFFVHHVAVEPRDRAYYDSYRKWLHEDGGAGFIHHHLRTMDLSKFNPHGAAYHTEAKAQMTNLARSDVERWVDDLRARPDEVLRLPGGAPVIGDLMPYSQIRALCAGALSVGEDRVSSLYRALASAGFARVNGGSPIRVSGAQPERYYAVRNVARWTDATLDELHAHLSGKLSVVPTPNGPGTVRPPGRKKY